MLSCAPTVGPVSTGSARPCSVEPQVHSRQQTGRSSPLTTPHLGISDRTSRRHSSSFSPVGAGRCFQTPNPAAEGWWVLHLAPLPPRRPLPAAAPLRPLCWRCPAAPAPPAGRRRQTARQGTLAPRPARHAPMLACLWQGRGGGDECGKHCSTHVQAGARSGFSRRGSNVQSGSRRSSTPWNGSHAGKPPRARTRHVSPRVVGMHLNGSRATGQRLRNVTSAVIHPR